MFTTIRCSRRSSATAWIARRRCGSWCTRYESTCVLGVTTNREYLIQILESKEFREGRAHTAFLPAPSRDTEGDSARVAAAVLYLETKHQTPFRNYRNNPYRDPSRKVRVADEEITVHWNQHEVRSGARTLAYRVHTPVNALNQITLEINGATPKLRNRRISHPPVRPLPLGRHHHRTSPPPPPPGARPVNTKQQTPPCPAKSSAS